MLLLPTLCAEARGQLSKSIQFKIDQERLKTLSYYPQLKSETKTLTKGNILGP